MCFRLAKPQPNVGEPVLELFGQPRTRGEATDEEHELLMGRQE